MNILSLFIYFAEVTNSLKGALNAGIFFGVAAFILTGITYLLWYNDDYSPRDEEDQETNKKFLKTLKIAGIVLLSSIAIQVLVPGKQTLYMIAASEMGETIWESEEAQGLHDDLRTIIKNYAQGEDK